ncbi:hypothetical protein Tco_1290823 [Tanacetum coccineum]
MRTHDNICFKIADELYESLPYDTGFHMNYTNKSLFTPNITLYVEDVFNLRQYCEDEADNIYIENVESQPMVWIGIYIAIASLVCTVAMAADLLHGLRNKKFWFPCKFFTLNAASITVITVAMKLPVDLTSEMPVEADQVAKLGSLAFMCTIMVNLMPSLASMDNKTLLANVIGLSILVITVIVNVIIQIHTSIIDSTILIFPSRYMFILTSKMVACIYAGMILLLLIITISSSLTIPTSKEILEFKYQGTNKTSSTDQQQTQMSKVEKLRQHVRRFWVMADTVKEKLFTPPIDSTGEINEDLSMYVLQINDEMELAERALKGISNSMNSFILKAEKEQNNGLLELLDWSLPIVTLTCIAVALSHIPKDSVMSLVKSVGEGLSYTHLVEESLNISSEYVNIRKATITLWHEVENNYKWLKNSLSKNAFEEMTATEILSWFSDKAEAIVIEINESSNGKMVEKISKELIAANSMYRIARTILHRDQSSTEPLSKKQLFDLINGMIADILCACFTNIPQVITMKCHESVIEKREASVKAAAKLLGKTTKIIERLETFELPSMDDDKMAYIDEWRLHFNLSIP